jgi:hypothetical protein
MIFSLIMLALALYAATHGSIGMTILALFLVPVGLFIRVP